MSKSIAAMHVAKKQLGLDEDTYRAALVQTTGKSSSADMTEAERQKVLEHFRERGFKAQSTGSRKHLEGRFAGKLQALWIAGWNLGLVRDRDDRALLVFVKRQTKIDHVRFLRHGGDAAKAIEALKGWLEREAGVQWPRRATATRPSGTFDLNRFAVVRAQLRILADNRRLPGDIDDAGLMALMNELGERIRKLPKAAP